MRTWISLVHPLHPKFPHMNCFAYTQFTHEALVFSFLTAPSSLSASVTALTEPESYTNLIAECSVFRGRGYYYRTGCSGQEKYTNTSVIQQSSAIQSKTLTFCITLWCVRSVCVRVLYRCILNQVSEPQSCQTLGYNRPRFLRNLISVCLVPRFFGSFHSSYSNNRCIISLVINTLSLYLAFKSVDFFVCDLYHSSVNISSSRPHFPSWG